MIGSREGGLECALKVTAAHETRTEGRYDLRVNKGHILSLRIVCIISSDTYHMVMSEHETLHMTISRPRRSQLDAPSHA